MVTCENIFAYEQNKGNYKLSIIAQLSDHDSARYIIRIEKPEGEKADYMSTLEGLKKFGELLIDLATFAEEKLYAKDTQQLKELLTAENIKTYVKFKKAAKFTK